MARTPDFNLLVDAILLVYKIRRSENPPAICKKGNFTVCPRCNHRFGWNHSRRHHNRPSCTTAALLHDMSYIVPLRKDISVKNKRTLNWGLSTMTKLILNIGSRYQEMTREIFTHSVNNKVKLIPSVFTLKHDLIRRQKGLRMGPAFLLTGKSDRKVPVIVTKVSIIPEEGITLKGEKYRKLSDLKTYEDVIEFVRERLNISKSSKCDYILRSVPSVRGSEPKRTTGLSMTVGKRKYLEFMELTPTEEPTSKRRAGLLSNSI